MPASARLLLLMPTTTYKAADFLAAAARVGVTVTVGAERRQALESQAPGGTLTLDFRALERSLGEIVALHERTPLAAVVATDDETTLLAALAGEMLGLAHNPPQAVRLTRDKYLMRCRLAEAGLRSPRFWRVGPGEAPEAAARTVDYPCVLKPLSLSASRGVLRADDPAGFVRALRRIRLILTQRAAAARGPDSASVLVETYLPGSEVALEGLLRGGRLECLALFDKPDPLTGPTFEETLYVTPSLWPAAAQAAIVAEAAAAARALDLREGPLHAELRLHDGVPWLIEVAARTIGGLCSHALRFGAGVALEDVVLRHALGLETGALERETGAAGVMMIPIPRAGVLERVDGLDAARAVPGVEEIAITIPLGAELIPLPEGHRYLGFIVARRAEPSAVERTLRVAHGRLGFHVGPSSPASG